MASYKKPFGLFKRKTEKKGKFIYYVSFRDENGNRMTKQTSGHTSKAGAERWAIEQLKTGEYLKRSKRLTDMTFADFVVRFWILTECSYIKQKLARGYNISESYASSQRGQLLLNILPYFGKRVLSEITPKHVEDWIFMLKDTKGYSNVHLNHIRVISASFLKKHFVLALSQSILQRLWGS